MSVKIYAPFMYKRFCRKFMHRQHFVRVGIECVPNGIIANAHEHGFGVYDTNGNFVESSRQWRGKRSQFWPKHAPNGVPYVDRDVVYFGNVFPHFGHFLLEHMNRGWAYARDEFRDMAAVLINDKGVNPVPGYVYDLLELLGIRRENIIILNESTRFKNVYIPGQAFNIPEYCAAEFVDTYEQMANNVRGEKYDKIYVSRARLKAGKTYGEEIIQNIFQQNGFHIIYPETLSLAQQIGFMKNCRVLAGCAGTALHLSLFMPRGGTVISMKRNRITKDNFDTQNLINMAKKFNSVYIAASVEKKRSDHGTVMPQIIGMTKYLRRFFDENGFKYDSNIVAPDESVWRQYDAALATFNDHCGSSFSVRIKNLVIKILACFIPGRERRGRFRHRMQRWKTRN